jgi:hypothetical protein
MNKMTRVLHAGAHDVYFGTAPGESHSGKTAAARRFSGELHLLQLGNQLASAAREAPVRSSGPSEKDPFSYILFPAGYWSCCRADL